MSGPRYPTDTLGDRTWVVGANCVGIDPEVFFPVRGESTKPAQAICRGCEVTRECLTYALRHGIKHGIWGGASERVRRDMRKVKVRVA